MRLIWQESAVAQALLEELPRNASRVLRQLCFPFRFFGEEAASSACRRSVLHLAMMWSNTSCVRGDRGFAWLSTSFVLKLCTDLRPEPPPPVARNVYSLVEA